LEQKHYNIYDDDDDDDDDAEREWKEEQNRKTMKRMSKQSIKQEAPHKTKHRYPTDC
jgi:hypothetical protein